MNLFTCRRFAFILAVVVIFCGAVIAFLPLPDFTANLLGIVCIVLTVFTVGVVVRWHRCPSCGRFVPVTGGYRACIHCDSEL